MNVYLRSATGLCLYLAMAFCSGCILFWQPAEYRYIPDPDADKFVKVVDANENKLLLADGRTIRLDGMDIESLTDDQKKIYDMQIKRIIIGLKVIAIDNNGFSRAEIVTYDDAGRHAGPQKRIIYVKPVRVDIALGLISDGFVGTNVRTVTDKEWKDKYLSAEKYAKLHRMGIWSSEKSAHN